MILPMRRRRRVLAAMNGSRMNLPLFFGLKAPGEPGGAVPVAALPQQALRRPRRLHPLHTIRF